MLHVQAAASAGRLPFAVIWAAHSQGCLPSVQPCMQVFLALPYLKAGATTCHRPSHSGHVPMGMGTHTSVAAPHA